MRRNAGIFSLLVLAGIIIFFVATKLSMVQKWSKDRGSLPLAAFETKAILLGKAPFTVFIADTPQKRAQGLMNVRELPPDHGMLFIFDQPQKFSFYNKNTLIPLDLLWIKNGVVEETSFLPANKGDGITFVHPSKPVDNVIELNAGSVERNNIKSGDGVELQ